MKKLSLASSLFVLLLFSVLVASPVAKTNQGTEQEILIATRFNAEEAHAQEISDWAKNNGLFCESDGEFIPNDGDLVFYDTDGDKKADVVGIVRLGSGATWVSFGEKDDRFSTAEVLGYASVKGCSQADKTDFAPDFTWV